MAEPVDASLRRSIRPAGPSIVPQAPIDPTPPRGVAATIWLAFLTLIVGTIEWAITPIRVLIRVLFAQSKRAPMRIADEVNALAASITKAAEGPHVRVLRTSNAELLAEMGFSLFRCAIGRPPKVVKPPEVRRDFPESYLVPFHAQPNGYLSLAAPAISERHMEVLYGSDLRVMRHAAASALGDNLRHGVVVDLGSGAGAMLRMLRGQHKRARLFGIELSPYMIAASYAHQLHMLDDHIEVIEGSVTELPFDDGTVRGVTATFVLHELPDESLKRALKEAIRVLCPGGRLVILDVAAPRSLRERVRFNVVTRVFHEPYSASFVQKDLVSYVRDRGLFCVAQRDMPRGTRLYVFERPQDLSRLN